jgi:ABC-type transport system substrate-binding protein
VFRNRKIVYLGLVVLLAFALGACAQPTEAPEPTSAPPPAEPTAAPPEPTAAPPFEGLTFEDPACSGFFSSIVAVDEHTVVFNLCKSDAAFLSKMAFSVFSIYPQEWLEATTLPGERLEAPVGTGPYRVEQWNRGESITFNRFPVYWGEPAITDTVVFRWSTESAARVLELQAGTVDGIDNPGPDDFAVIEGDPNLLLLERPALNTFYLAMTNTFEPFDDVNVRKAVAMGIDRQRIVDTFYPRGSEVASHFTPCAIQNACTGDTWYDFDPEAARALLAEAGFPNGFATNLFYRDVVRGYLPQVSNVAQDLQAQLKENLNIDATIVVMESGAFIEACTSGTCDGLYMLGWGADYPHVTNFLDFHFGSANPQFGNQDPRYFEVLAEAATIGDPSVSEPLYAEANNALREYVPMLPIAHGGSAVAYRADVVGAQASPLSNEYFAVMDPGGRRTFVWMQNAEPISLFCADETDGESLRACEQVMEPLYTFEVGGVTPIPALATSCEPNEDSTVWTCALREGVQFHDGSKFDANDVVTTFQAGLDASSVLHIGNTNLWEYYTNLWGLVNAGG